MRLMQIKSSVVNWRDAGFAPDLLLTMISLYNLIQQQNVVKSLTIKAKLNYFSDLIQDADNKTIFSHIDTLLHRKPERKLPTSSSTKCLTSKFIKFFRSKIMSITETSTFNYC